MENKSHALAAGSFVLLVAALLAALAMWLTSDQGVTKSFELSSHEAVTGLQPQAAVRFKGVSVGRVTDIGFDPDIPGNVLIRIAVQTDAPLTPTTFATLSGLAFVQLDDDGVATPVNPAKGSSGVPRLPLRNSQLGELSDKVPVLLAQVQEATQRLNHLLGDENQKNFALALQGAAQSSASIQRLTQSLERSLSQRVDPALAALPLLAASTEKTLHALQTSAADVSRTAQAIIWLAVQR